MTILRKSKVYKKVKNKQKIELSEVFVSTRTLILRNITVNKLCYSHRGEMKQLT